MLLPVFVVLQPSLYATALPLEFRLLVATDAAVVLVRQPLLYAWPLLPESRSLVVTGAIVLLVQQQMLHATLLLLSRLAATDAIV